MARRIEIDGDDPDEAKAFGITVINFDRASGNRILLPEEAYAQTPLALHFGGRDNYVDLRCGPLPQGTIRFFGDGAIFTSFGETQNFDIDVYAHTGSRVTIESPKAIHGLKAIAYDGSSIMIGSGCLVAENTIIMTSDHHSIIDLDTGRQLNHPGDVTLEGDVWLGWGCSILKGVRVGRGSIVAAHAVVTSDVGVAELWAGIPARRIKSRVSWVASHPANPFDVHRMMESLSESAGVGRDSRVPRPEAGPIPFAARQGQHRTHSSPSKP